MTSPNGDSLSGVFIGLAVGVLACAGVGIGKAVTPAKGATASGGRRSGGDDVVHEVDGQGQHGARGADDGVFLDGKTGQTAKAADA